MECLLINFLFLMPSALHTTVAKVTRSHRPRGHLDYFGIPEWQYLVLIEGQRYILIEEIRESPNLQSREFRLEPAIHLSSLKLHQALQQ